MDALLQLPSAYSNHINLHVY